tara:strand:- start:227 stop:343 length:117 start_codon:yes stop_codon:yes gene_type:complete
MFCGRLQKKIASPLLKSVVEKEQVWIRKAAKNALFIQH